MQSYGIPNLATVEEIGQKLQRGEIQRWFIDPNQQVSGDESRIGLSQYEAPNLRISFVTNGGGLYIVHGRYDQQTNQILPPVIVPQHVTVPQPVTVPTKGTLREPSLIRWENTYQIIDNSRRATPRVSNNYTDNEINGQVSRDYFNPLFQSIDSFQSERYVFYCRTASTHNGEQCSLVKEWTSGNSRLQFWITTGTPYTIGEFFDVPDMGWYIVYGTAETFLIVGNSDSHPFVVTPMFSFGNTDGSTEETIDFPSLNLDQVKYLLKTKAIEYIFNQIH